MTTRKPKASPAQHAAQAPIRKAKRAANQRKADARLYRLLGAAAYRCHEWVLNGTCNLDGRTYYREFAFAEGRRWKFDCAFIAEKIAIEIDGGQWQITGRDQTREAERSNAATLAGWLVLHFTSAMIDTDVAGCAELLRQAFAMREKYVPVLDEQGIPKGFFYPLQSPQSPQTPISGSAAISTRRHHQ